MTGTKGRKILISLNECDSKEQTPYVNLSVTNLRQQPILDFHQSSLLADCKMTGLFSGDRFIPYRPEETHLDGCEQYMHEESLLHSNMLRMPRHRNEDAEMASDNSRRSHSTPSSHTSSNSSNNSNRSASERVHRNSRRRQLAYANMLNQQCFQDPDSQSLQNLSHADMTSTDLTVAPISRDQAKP
jgi:hypothetical protein